MVPAHTDTQTLAEVWHAPHDRAYDCVKPELTIRIMKVFRWMCTGRKKDAELPAERIARALIQSLPLTQRDLYQMGIFRAWIYFAVSSDPGASRE